MVVTTVPCSVGGNRRRCVIRSQFLAQLEDGQTHGNYERKEGQLQRIPSLQTEDTERQWDQCDGLEEDENKDRN